MKDWNAICDRCGFQYKSYELFREWTGHMVCRRCLDPREFEPRIRPERTVVAYPEPPGIDVGAARYILLGSGEVDITGTGLGLGIGLPAGSISITGTDADFGVLTCRPLLQVEYDNDSDADISGNDMVPTDTGTPIVSGGIIELPSGTHITTYTDGGNGEINAHNADDFTIEFYVNPGDGLLSAADHRLVAIGGTSSDSRVVLVRHTGDANYGKIYYRDGTFNVTGSIFASSALTIDAWTHVAVCVSPAAADKIVSIYYNGTRVAHSTGLDFSPLPTANGQIDIGAINQASESVFLDDIRVSPCFIYSGASFTPPARGSLINPP